MKEGMMASQLAALPSAQLWYLWTSGQPLSLPGPECGGDTPQRGLDSRGDLSPIIP